MNFKAIIIILLILAFAYGWEVGYDNFQSGLPKLYDKEAPQEESGSCEDQARELFPDEVSVNGRYLEGTIAWKGTDITSEERYAFRYEDSDYLYQIYPHTYKSSENDLRFSVRFVLKPKGTGFENPDLKLGESIEVFDTRTLDYEIHSYDFGFCYND